MNAAPHARFPGAAARAFGIWLGSAAAGYVFGNWYFRQGWGVGWKTSQFFFSYQDLGFVARGLIGSLLRPFPFLQRSSAILLLCGLFLVVFVGWFAAAFRRAAPGLEPRDRRLLLALLALNPALFLHQGLDLGRFDLPGFLLFFAALGALRRGAWLLAGAASGLGLLVHEAFLLLNLPLLVAFALALPRPGGRADWYRLLLPPAVSALAVFTAGRYEAGLPALAEHFARSPGFLAATAGVVDQDPLAVITRGVAENLAVVRSHFWNAKAYIHVPVILAWGTVMTLFVRDFLRANGLRPGPGFYASFSPLLLSSIACDHYRWVAIAATNLFIVVLAEAAELARAGRRIVLPRRMTTWILLATVVCGPIGHAKSFPLLFLYPKYVLTGTLAR